MLAHIKLPTLARHLLPWLETICMLLFNDVHLHPSFFSNFNCETLCTNLYFLLLCNASVSRCPKVVVAAWRVVSVFATLHKAYCPCVALDTYILWCVENKYFYIFVFFEKPLWYEPCVGDKHVNKNNLICFARIWVTFRPITGGAEGLLPPRKIFAPLEKMSDI